MRMIREMLGNDDRVWVYIIGEEIWKKYANMAVAEGSGFTVAFSTNMWYNHRKEFALMNKFTGKDTDHG